MANLTIGVLALQGAFAKHIEVLNKLGVTTREVRRPEDLQECDALVIPGGESTTILRQIKFIGLESPLRAFAAERPLFGTCAGLILISKEIVTPSTNVKHPMQPFCLIDVSVERNAFGRQAESFQCPIEMHLDNSSKPQNFPALFIRAPRIRHCGKEVEVLAKYEGEPILVRQGFHLGATFHPELTSDHAVHLYFLRIVKQRS